MLKKVDVTPEEEDQIIEYVANKISNYGLEVVGIMMLETIKPISYFGGQMGYFFTSPFLPLFGENIQIKGDKFFGVFEKHENVDKLIKLIEQKTVEENQKNELRKKMDNESSKKKGWRRFIPFLKGTIS